MNRLGHFASSAVLWIAFAGFVLLLISLFSSRNAGLSSPAAQPVTLATNTPVARFTPVTPYPTVYFPPGMTPISAFPPPGVTPPPGNPGGRILTPTPRPTAPPPFIVEKRVIYSGGASWVSWSPTGDKILFLEWTRQDTANIFITDPAGTSVKLIARSSGFRTPIAPREYTVLPNPVWSPDGRQILYAVANAAGYNELWVMTSDGGDRVKVADADSHRYLKWLKNGRIAFLRDGLAHTVDQKGQGRQQIGREKIMDALVANLSPDGTKIVDNIGGVLTVMNTDGTGKKMLGATLSGESAWSHDGTQLAYLRTRTEGGSFQSVWIADRDGNNPKMIAGGDEAVGWNYGLEWAPDNTWLAFGHTPPGAGTGTEGAIFVARPDGWGLHPLVTRGVSAPLTWSPEKSLVAFVRYSNPDDLSKTTLELVVARLQY